MKKTISIILIALVGLLNAQTPVIPDNQIRCYFSMNGNANDYKALKTPTTTNVTYNNGCGAVNQGASFDGSTSFITYNCCQAFNCGNITFNVGFVIKTTSTLTSYVYGQSNSANTASTQAFYGYIDTLGAYHQVLVKGSTKTDISTGTVTVNDGNKHLIFFQCDRLANKIYLWVDDVLLVNQTFAAGTINQSSNKFSIGRLGEYNANYFNGCISEFGIFLGLTTAQGSSLSTYLYNSGSFRTAPF